MKINNRRKVCAAVLALGLAALALDRTVFNSGDEAISDSASGVPAPAVRASVVGGEALDRGLAVLSVGQRLDEYRRTREGARIADAFAAVGGWFEKAAQKQAPVAEPVTGEFSLSSVSGNLATVNGTVINMEYETEILMDKHTGRRAAVRLISVDKRARSAVIETDGQRVELKLDGPENEKK